MNCPYSLETIVKECFKFKGDCIPDIYDIVFSCWHNDGEIWMIWYSTHVICMTLVKGEETLFGLIVPDFDMTIITSWNKMGSVKSHAKVKAINSSLVTNQWIVCTLFLCWNCPNFYSFIKRGTSEHLSIFRIDSNLHDIVIMVLIRIDFLPFLIPIKQFNGLIIRATENIRKSGVNCDASYEVNMLFYSYQFLLGIVIEHSQFVVIRSYYYPLLSWDKFSTSNRGLSDFKGPNLGLLIVIIDSHIPSIESNENPRKRRVKFNSFDSFWPC